ncbi:Crp/Fnr family transcriptional regulator [Pseudidiomarina gelatinasegens]|uniref:Crp/Fnr family transcriptional regulator n=1 Tax=Pseudidiomarina gelatinasegens TaxID=2487740 RepID=A0A443YZ42_9GAMM|nr:Crp/Fnr family transcriptional regulator [Pseudidiomarina gelatinasegens]RWU09382.1 Crp/Fnr family transcriptional regulator [Pseudidiomarina gelatinasegens]
MNTIKQQPDGNYPLPSLEQNYLLSSLPADVRERLKPHLQLITLPLGKCLYESGDEQKYVYFPTNSIISLVYVLFNGDSAEISVVGNEGMLGLPLFMGGGSTPNRAVVQSAGNAYQLSARLLKEEFRGHDQLHELLLRYTQSLMTQMAQTAVCNRHHSIEQQLCRWILLSLDRIPSNVLTMTQELIADMLGVRREGVSVAAGKLQKLGVIEYHRGVVTVLNRVHLEKLSCECYEVVKAECERLLHYLPEDYNLHD